jgi:hypothetical protein
MSINLLVLAALPGNRNMANYTEAAHIIPEFLTLQNGQRWNVAELMAACGPATQHRTGLQTVTRKHKPLSVWDNLIRLSVSTPEQIRALYPRSTLEDCAAIQRYANMKILTNTTQKRRREEYLEGLKS